MRSGDNKRTEASKKEKKKKRSELNLITIHIEGVRELENVHYDEEMCVL